MKKLTTAILVLLAMTLTGCKNDNNRYVRFVDSYTIYTDTIRGHVYMHVYGGGILHAPDCPCREKGGGDVKEEDMCTLKYCGHDEGAWLRWLWQCRFTCEYMRYRYSYNKMDECIAELCKLGADGWEIATCAGEDSFAAYLILKRETLHTS